MSRIDELIAEHCPDGVEFFELSQIFEIRNGYTPSKSQSSFWNNGTIPWFRMEDIRENGKILASSLQSVHESAVKGKGLFPANSILVATSATIGEHALITVPHLSNQRFTSLAVNERFKSKLDIQFVHYYCFALDEWCLNNTSTSSFASVDMSGFKKFRFPIPPLEVQLEIVRILDAMTSLQAELQAELAARRSQYEFYRDSLLNFNTSGNNSMKKMKLDELCNISMGEFVKKTLQDDDYEFPVYNGGATPTGYYSKSNAPEESIVISARGSIGVVNFVSTKSWIGNSCFLIRAKEEEISNRFLYHYLKKSEPELYSRRTVGTIPALNMKPVKDFLVPVPIITEQNRIVEILDKFDSLTNDFTVGLPAEIKARRKQYEYYRDKLLTFKELAA